MNYRYRISQEDLQHLYRTARQRKEAHAELAEEYTNKVDQCTSFKTEREALKAALDKIVDIASDLQIYAGVEKDGKIYRIIDRWIVTDDIEVRMAAEYIGFALMYDGTRLQTIFDNKVNIDDVIAY